jgi:FdhE protein
MAEAQTIPIRSASEPPAIIAPEADLFTRRAQRFEQLAEGHTLGDWLGFLATLSRAQQAALDAFPAIALPDDAERARAREHHMPPLPAQSWPRNPAWHDAMRQIAAAIRPAAPSAARTALDRLVDMAPERREDLAQRVLQTELYGIDAALLPYVAAALQVLWTAGASRLGAAGIAPLDVPGVCPCCGFLPVASIVKGVGEVSNLRYLHCALCNTEWNLVRVKCAACDATEGIGYQQLQDHAETTTPDRATVRAETCDSCNSYLKIIHPDKGAVDPVADDLATLALDILVDEAGYARAGPNLLLVPGG